MATKKKSAHTKMRKIGARKHTHLIPIEKRQAVVVRMTKQGKSTGEMAYALGWTKGEGYGMVKRLQIAGKVRKADRKGRK